MRLYSINTGLFKLDGGAMHGVVPKTIWNKLNPADENNLCIFAMRCMLIECENRLILIDTGCGDKQDASFFKHYYLHGNDTLLSSIEKAGFGSNEITDVILTHMHFDHVGGATIWNSDRTKAVPTFKNAKYWVHEQHWNWALRPNPREGASFLKENFMPIQELGVLNFIKDNHSMGIPEIKFKIVNGHTEAMLIPLVQYREHTVCFMADLIPTIVHLPLPYLASYDIRPLDAMIEKKAFLEEAVANNYLLFYEHDAFKEMSRLKMTEKGVRASDLLKLNEI
ncbi:MAG: MBL fold metallo-hydrolase [Bacteroidota bacterium]|nr:MBL fold metallo-hydrolase [Bacteroidota bacterium]